MCVVYVVFIGVGVDLVDVWFVLFGGEFVVGIGF